jgi:hypothetical protein
MINPWISRDITIKIWKTGVFALAMGFFEAILVIYLRELYYPEGFEFPLKLIEPRIFSFELLRELSTMIMLICIGLLAGKTILQQFGFFLFSFAVWDLFYYCGLKLLIGWPDSLLTWDILFLIPITWVGPVIAPVICSFSMIYMAALLFAGETAKKHFRLISYEWVLIISGAVIIFISFIRDYTYLFIRGGYLNELSSLSTNEDFINKLTSYVPESFTWGIFLLGEVLIIFTLIIIHRRIAIIRKKPASYRNNQPC